MVNDPMFIFAGILGFYGAIWLLYGLVHFNVPRQGLGMLGYIAVAIVAVATIVFVGYGFFAPDAEPVFRLQH